jgi:hypothetical protein
LANFASQSDNSSGSATNTYTYAADGRLLTAARETATIQYAGNMIYKGTALFMNGLHQILSKVCLIGTIVLSSVSCLPMVSCHERESTNKKDTLIYELKHSFILMDESNLHISGIPYLFFDCCIYNLSQDTITWHHLNFNRECLLKRQSFPNATYARLITGDSIELFSESYEFDEQEKVYPHDTLRFLLTMDAYIHEKNMEVKYDSIIPLIKDIVYYSSNKRQATFIYSDTCQYLKITPILFEIDDCAKSALLYLDHLDVWQLMNVIRRIYSKDATLTKHDIGLYLSSFENKYEHNNSLLYTKGNALFYLLSSDSIDLFIEVLNNRKDLLPAVLFNLKNTRSSIPVKDCLSCINSTKSHDQLRKQLSEALRKNNSYKEVDEFVYGRATMVSKRLGYDY